jgi:hypothetical protein
MVDQSVTPEQSKSLPESGRLFAFPHLPALPRNSFGGWSAAAQNGILPDSVLRIRRCNRYVGVLAFAKFFL